MFCGVSIGLARHWLANIWEAAEFRRIPGKFIPLLVPPVLRTERIAHLSYGSSAALRDFDPAYVADGSFASFPPSRRVRFAPKADIRPVLASPEYAH